MHRNANESFLDFKKRRIEIHQKTKIALKGKLFWPSKKLGTYAKKEKTT